MGHFTARLTRVEARTQDRAWCQRWLALFRQAATQVPLDARSTQQLLAAIQTHHLSLDVPPPTTEAAASAYVDALFVGVDWAIRQHVPPALQAAYREVASALCWQEAQV